MWLPVSFFKEDAVLGIRGLSGEKQVKSSCSTRDLLRPSVMNSLDSDAAAWRVIQT